MMRIPTWLRRVGPNQECEQVKVRVRRLERERDETAAKFAEIDEDIEQTEDRCLADAAARDKRIRVLESTVEELTSQLEIANGKLERLEPRIPLTPELRPVSQPTQNSVLEKLLKDLLTPATANKAEPGHPK